MTITVTLHPAYTRKKRLRVDVYEARLHGEALCISAQPLLDSSRVLLDRGFSPFEKIQTVHITKPHAVRLISTIGYAAQFDVMGERFIRRKSHVAGE